MNILDTIRGYIFQVGFLPIILFSGISSLYIYWLESKKMKKNQNSIFDGFFLSSLLTLIWGRIAYILANPQSYEGLIWSAVPYEKYPDGFYVFRLLPWRYFRIWDGEFLLPALFVGFFIFSFLYSVVIKKWRWREMMASVTATSVFSFGILLFIYGFVTSINTLLIQGGVLISLTVIYLIVSAAVRTIFLNQGIKIWERFNYLTIFIYSLASYIYIPWTLLKSGITDFDKWNIYVFAMFAAVSIILFVIDVMRKTVIIKTEYKTRSVSISTNQPVKI